MRRVDVYVVAVRPDVDGEPWLVLREKGDDHFLTCDFVKEPRSRVSNGRGGFKPPKITSFRADYPSLEQKSRSRVNIKLGRDELLNVVHVLFKGEMRDTSTMAQSFIVVNESIAEALRFNSMCEFIDGRFIMGVGEMPEEKLVDYQTQWGKFFTHLFNHAYQLQENNPLVMVGGKAVSTKDAETIVAMIKGTKL